LENCFKKKRRWLQQDFFVRMGYDSWKGEWAGIGDGPCICVRLGFRKHFHTSGLYLPSASLCQAPQPSLPLLHALCTALRTPDVTLPHSLVLSCAPPHSCLLIPHSALLLLSPVAGVPSFLCSSSPFRYPPGAFPDVPSLSW
jgi:hypothetical protein